MGALSAFSIICCVWGIAISVYALHVERSHEKDVNYQAMCDIGPRFSCSKVLTSRYSRGLGLVGPLLGEDHPLNVPNAIAGLVYYTVMMFLSCCPLAGISLLLSLAATAASIYLSFVLVFILSDLCVVCLAVYVVNSALLAASYAAWRKPRKSHKELLTVKGQKGYSCRRKKMELWKT